MANIPREILRPVSQTEDNTARIRYEGTRVVPVRVFSLNALDHSLITFSHQSTARSIVLDHMHALPHVLEVDLFRDLGFSYLHAWVRYNIITLA